MAGLVSPLFLIEFPEKVSCCCSSDAQSRRPVPQYDCRWQDDRPNSGNSLIISHQVRFLNERQKYIALKRVKSETSSVEIVHPTAKQTLGMLLDWKLLTYGFMYFIQASSVYSLAFFAPIILRQGLGFTYAKAQLLSSPPYVFTIFASIAGAWVSDKIKMRWPVMITQSAIGIIGLLVVLYAKPPGVRYFGLFLATYGTQGLYTEVLVLLSKTDSR